MRIHVAIVSDQLLPTVIPCLMHRPDRVVLVASKAMAAKADRLRRVLEDAGVQVAIQGEAPDAGLDRIHAYAAKLADELTAGLHGDEVVLNVTGGTKLMTLGFVDVFRERADRIIYTDTAHARIEVIYDRHRNDPPFEPMGDLLDVPHYLAVQGFRYQRDASQEVARLAKVEARREAAAFLARRAGRLGGWLTVLNALAHRAWDGRSDALKEPEQRFSEEPYGEVPQALACLEAAGLLQRMNARTIRFTSIEAVRFVGGGWLEEYAFLTARNAGLADVRLGVTGVWEGTERARNEFDVLACHWNRLLFIECKTLRFKEGENDNELAYKVTSLGEDVRGLFGETWVLTAQEPTKVLTDRANQAGFRLVGPRLLESLPAWVSLWKKGQSAP